MSRSFLLQNRRRPGHASSIEHQPAQAGHIEPQLALAVTAHPQRTTALPGTTHPQRTTALPGLPRELSRSAPRTPRWQWALASPADSYEASGLGKAGTGRQKEGALLVASQD